MKILVACEESQRVCIEFRRLGHEAYSCDIEDCSGGHPEWHIKQDVLPLLNGNCIFETCDGTLHSIVGKWDMLIAFPPCTHLAVSGARWFPEKQKDFRQQKACIFFMHFVLADCDRIAIENPIGIMSTCYRKPDQIIHPYMFGDPVRKATCLWLKGLNPLEPTNEVEPEIIDDGKTTYSGPAYYVKDEDGKILSWKDPRTAKARSKTYEGVARAMAEQWGTQL